MKTPNESTGTNTVLCLMPVKAPDAAPCMCSCSTTACMDPRPVSGHYTNGVSFVRCLLALLVGAAVMSMFLYLLEWHYEPLTLPTAPTLRSTQEPGGPGDASIIVYESFKDAAGHQGDAWRSLPVAAPVFASRVPTEVAPLEAESP